MTLQEAKRTHAKRLCEEAQAAAKFHATEAIWKEWVGEDYAEDRILAARYGGLPNRNSLSLISKAETVAELEALTVDQLFT